MLNRVFLIGNLVADPEIRYTPSGSPVGSFRLACTEKFKSRDGGEMKEQTLFINCSVWGNQATVVQQYLKKEVDCLLRVDFKSGITNRTESENGSPP